MKEGTESGFFCKVMKVPKTREGECGRGSPPVVALVLLPPAASSPASRRLLAAHQRPSVLFGEKKKDLPQIWKQGVQAGKRREEIKGEIAKGERSQELEQKRRQQKAEKERGMAMVAKVGKTMSDCCCSQSKRG